MSHPEAGSPEAIPENGPPADGISVGDGGGAGRHSVGKPPSAAPQAQPSMETAPQPPPIATPLQAPIRRSGEAGSPHPAPSASPSNPPPLARPIPVQRSATLPVAAPDDDERADDVGRLALRHAPPWLISAVVHMILPEALSPAARLLVVTLAAAIAALVFFAAAARELLLDLFRRFRPHHDLASAARDEGVENQTNHLD